MADFVTQPENITPNTSAVIVEETQNSGSEPLDGTEKKTASAPLPIIWTPRFIMLFFLTTVIGLSAESIFTQGWLNKAYKAEWILLTHVLLILISMIVLSIRARSLWIRIGSIFGSIWAIFIGASHVATLLGINGRSFVALQFQAVTACALLATYICFSTYRIAFRRWDNLFFWFVPFGGGGAVAILYTCSNGPAPHKGASKCNDDRFALSVYCYLVATSLVLEKAALYHISFWHRCSPTFACPIDE